jgi:hypothetical protein
MNQNFSSPAPKQGAVIGGWVCFVLGAGLMYLSLWTFWLYLPMMLAAFVLSIAAMSQRRIVNGLSLMLVVLIVSPIEWFCLAAYRGDKFVQKVLPPEQLAAYNEGKAVGKELGKQYAAPTAANVPGRRPPSTPTEELSQAEAFERRLANAVESHPSAPSVIQLNGDTVPIVYEIKAPHPTPRESIARYILGYTYRDLDAFSKRDFLSMLGKSIDNWVAKAKPDDLYSATVHGYQFGEYDFEKNAFPTHIHAYWDHPDQAGIQNAYGDAYGEHQGDVDLNDENGNRVLEQNGKSSESNTEYLICFQNRKSVEFAPLPPEKARALAQSMAKTPREVTMTFSGTLAKCVETVDRARPGGAPYDSSTKRIYLQVSEMKIAIPKSGESMTWKVSTAAGAARGAKDQAQESASSKSSMAPAQRDGQADRSRPTVADPSVQPPADAAQEIATLAASPAPSSSRSPLPVASTADVETDPLEAWLRSYVAASDQNDPEAEARFYADTFDLFEEGQMTRERFVKDLRAYQRLWPERKTVLLSKPVFKNMPGDRKREIRFSYRFEAKNADAYSRGRVDAVMVASVDNEVPHIVSLKQEVSEREKGTVPRTAPPAPLAQPEGDAATTVREPEARSAEPAKRFTIVGVPEGDSLNVHSAPAMKSPTVFTLMNGDAVQLAGLTVFNGDTEWFPIVCTSGTGWVSRKYLKPER